MYDMEKLIQLCLKVVTEYNSSELAQESLFNMNFMTDGFECAIDLEGVDEEEAIKVQLFNTLGDDDLPDTVEELSETLKRNYQKIGLKYCDAFGNKPYV